jgi:hypothetical protein
MPFLQSLRWLVIYKIRDLLLDCPDGSWDEVSFKRLPDGRIECRLQNSTDAEVIDISVIKQG